MSLQTIRLAVGGEEKDVCKFLDRLAGRPAPFDDPDVLDDPQLLASLATLGVRVEGT